MSVDCGCHCEGCPTCRETAELAALIRQEYLDLERTARVPTAEIVWWRAQTRARHEATRMVTRPILFTQALAIATLMGLLAAVAGRLSLESWSWTAVAQMGADVQWRSLAIAAGAWIVIAPLALYFASPRD